MEKRSPSILRFFSNPHQNRCPPWGIPPLLKMKTPPIWKTAPFLLKHETPLHEMIPRKSAINNNVAKILEKYVWRSSYLVNLQACRLIVDNFTIKWTPSQVLFVSVLSPLHAPPIKFWRANPRPPPPCSQHLWETLLMGAKSLEIALWYFRVKPFKNLDLFIFGGQRNSLVFFFHKVVLLT